MASAGIILICAITGMVISLYMTHKYYRLKEAQPGESVVQTPYARVFLLPNSLYGSAYYGGMAALSLVRLTTGRWFLLAPALIVSLLAAALSLYLAWALLFKIKQTCPLCFTAQILNLIITVSLLLTFRY